MVRRWATVALALALVACTNNSDDARSSTRTSRRAQNQTTTTAAATTTTTTSSAQTTSAAASRPAPTPKQRLRNDGPLRPADVAIVGDYENTRGDLTLGNSTNGDRQLVFDSDDQLRVAHVAWSPDGKTLAFQLFGPGGYKPNFEGRHIVALQLVLLDMATGRARIASDHTAVSDSQIRWSPDGKYVAYVLDEGKGEPPHAVAVDVAAGTETRLAATGLFMWMPDSRAVLYDTCGVCEGYAPLFRASIDGSAATAFADRTESANTNDEPPTGYFDDNAPSPIRPDGKAIRVDRREASHLPSHPLMATFSPRRFYALPGQNVWWLGDGTKAIYASNTTLGVVDTATCSPRPADPPCGDQREFDTKGTAPCNVVPSPDAKRLVYSTCLVPRSDRAIWYVLDVATGATRELLGVDRAGAGFRAAWLSNDQLLVPAKPTEYLVMNREGEILRSLGNGSAVSVRPKT